VKAKGRYLFLARHASRQVAPGVAESDHKMVRWKEGVKTDEDPFKVKGYPRTVALAGQLCNELEGEDLVISSILHSRHTVAVQTAEVFEEVLRARGRLTGDLIPCAGLTPGSERSSEGFKLKTEGIKSGEGWLVIGHQPQLAQLAGEVKKLKLPGRVLPLDNSEVACIRVDPRPRLRWLLTAKPDTLLMELKAKIASKFEVAKFFLGALVVGTGLTLNTDIWQSTDPGARLLAGLGVFAALVSLTLTVATLLSYDRLLMPTTFWQWVKQKFGLMGKKKLAPHWSVERPPSQAHVVLFYEMVHVWNVFFVPALALALSALGLLSAAIAYQGLVDLNHRWPLLLILIGLLIVALGVPFLRALH